MPDAKLVPPMSVLPPIIGNPWELCVSGFLVYQFITLCQFYKGPYVTRERNCIQPNSFSKRDVLLRTSLTKFLGVKNKWGLTSWNLIEKRTNLAKQWFIQGPSKQTKDPEPERWWGSLFVMWYLMTKPCPHHQQRIICICKEWETILSRVSSATCQTFIVSRGSFVVARKNCPGRGAEPPGARGTPRRGAWIGLDAAHELSWT